MMTQNGKGAQTYPNGKEEYRRELTAQIEWEEREVLAGRAENAILMRGIAGNWSVTDYLKVAFWKGKSWRYLSALSDQSLQIQGYAILHFVAEAAGADLAEMIMRKSMSALERYREIYGTFRDRMGDNSFITQLYEETCEDIVQFARDHRHNYHRKVGRLLE